LVCLSETRRRRAGGTTTRQVATRTAQTPDRRTPFLPTKGNPPSFSQQLIAAARLAAASDRLSGRRTLKATSNAAAEQRGWGPFGKWTHTHTHAHTHTRTHGSSVAGWGLQNTGAWLVWCGRWVCVYVCRSGGVRACVCPPSVVRQLGVGDSQTTKPPKPDPLLALVGQAPPIRGRFHPGGGQVFSTGGHNTMPIVVVRPSVVCRVVWSFDLSPQQTDASNFNFPPRPPTSLAPDPRCWPCRH
jgi:hypothetical protein